MSVQDLGRWFATHVATPTRIISLSGCILLAGVLFEYFKPEWKVSAFSRSGSCLVAFAILCVFVNHSLEKTVADHRQFIKGFDYPEKQLLDHVASQFKDKRHAPQAVQHIKQMVGAAKTESETFSSTRAVLSVTEATAGIFGTLVWGFGDLLFPAAGILGTHGRRVGDLLLSLF